MIRRYSVLCCLALLVFAACKKHDPPVTPPANTFTGRSTLFSGLRYNWTNLSVTAGVAQTVTGGAGTRLKFYPNSFKDASGNPITSGTIQLRLTEIYKPGGMISNRSTTVANGNLLISGGQVLLKASQNGQEVFASAYGIGFRQPSSSSQPMTLFYGSNNNADSVVTWTEGGGRTANGTVADTTSQWAYYYQFDSCTSFNWINCDFFYNSSAPKTNVTAVLPDTSFNPTNTMVFMVFPAINSVSYMGPYSYNTHAFSLSTSYYVPTGMTMHLVSISHKNSSYYFDKQLNLTTTSGISVTMNPQPQTLAYIQNQLASL